MKTRRRASARRLRTGVPPWAPPHLTRVHTTGSMAGRTADVVVIGAGISGACVSRALAATGRKVLLLDQLGPARGSTLASTALITFELDLPMHLLARRIGTTAAVAAWRHSLDATQRLRALVREENLSCGWSERDSLYLAGNAYGHRALRAEVAMRKAHGIPGDFLAAKQLREEYGIDRTGAIHSEGVAVADPVRLTTAILQSIVGLEMQAPVIVQSAVAGRDRVMLETDRGRVRGNAVVFCTGYALLPCLPSAGLSVDSTWAIATAPRGRYPEWLDRTIVWEASDPYLYLRTTGDGRLIVGGRDEDGAKRHLDARLMAEKSQRIVADARRLLGLADLSVEYRWSGAFGSSAGGLPMIGPVPGLPGCHVVAGFGGNGITHAMLAGEVLAADLTGQPIPFRELYRPGNTAAARVSVAR